MNNQEPTCTKDANTWQPLTEAGKRSPILQKIMNALDSEREATALAATHNYPPGEPMKAMMSELVRAAFDAGALAAMEAGVKETTQLKRNIWEIVAAVGGQVTVPDQIALKNFYNWQLLEMPNPLDPLERIYVAREKPKRLDS